MKHPISSLLQVCFCELEDLLRMCAVAPEYRLFCTDL